MDFETPASSLNSARDLPDDKSLLTAFKAAVERSPAPRNRFYERMAATVGDTALMALQDSIAGRACMHVLSAPAGSGKTTLTNAFIEAMIEVVLLASALVVVEQIKSVEARFRDLDALLPGKVACWTSEYRTVEKAELTDYPVAIVTHATFAGADSHKARRWVHGARLLTVVDERIKEVTVYDASPQAVRRVWEEVSKDGDEAARHAVDALDLFVTRRIHDRKALDHLSDQGALEMADCLQWFKRVEASRWVADHKDDAAVFGFARSLVDNYAFITGEGGETHLIGYENNMVIDPGTIQLDATADIDGVSQLRLYGRKLQPVPRVTYEGLRTVLVKPPRGTGARLTEYLGQHDNAIKYREWVVETIKQNTEPGLKALVVCRLDLTERRGRYLPDWDREDPRWSLVQQDPAGFHWDLEGRHIAVTYWGGDNIGNNAWQDADAVFLFDADYRPRRTIVADTQGMLKAKPLDARGPLVGLTSVRRKHAVVDGYMVGGLLRAHKQLALRGKARRFDEHGRCAPQLLVCGLANYSWLLENWQEAFPGAPAPVLKVEDTESGTYAQRVLALLSRPDTPDRVATRDLDLGKPWREISKDVITPAFRRTLGTLGWTYAGRGRGGAAFVRNVGVGP
jgi:hypothetical protein